MSDLFDDLHSYADALEQRVPPVACGDITGAEHRAPETHRARRLLGLAAAAVLVIVMGVAVRAAVDGRQGDKVTVGGTVSSNPAPVSDSDLRAALDGHSFVSESVAENGVARPVVGVGGSTSATPRLSIGFKGDKV